MPGTGPKPPHYRGSYHVEARAVRAKAYADPATRCWRCGRTIDQIHATHPRAKWTAGHVIDSQPGGTLLPECSPCNYSNGAKLRHARTQRTSLTW